MEKEIEGVILSVVPFKERDEIATIFTPEGKISLIRKWGRTSKKGALTPLTRCEFFMEEGRGELKILKEMRLIDAFLSHRNDFETLKAALVCLKAIQITQEGEVPSEPLYRLFIKILEALPAFPDKAVLVSLFYLKILLYDALIPLEALDLEMAELAATTSIKSLYNKSYPKAFHDKVEKLFKES
jgi:DNA repair protein RecO